MSVNSLELDDAHTRQRNVSSLDHVIPCHLSAVITSRKPMLAYCQLRPKMRFFTQIESLFQEIHWRCRRQNIGHFVNTFVYANPILHGLDLPGLYIATNCAANILQEPCRLTHWGRVVHICVSKYAIIGSDNDSILLAGTLGTNLSEILIKTHYFSYKKCMWKCHL